MGKSKDQERRTAKVMYVEQFKDAKEISRLVNVSEKTLGEWIRKAGWKAERDARANGHKRQIEEIRKVISSITERRLSLDKRISDAETKGDKELAESLRMESISLGDEVSKWNKTLENLDKGNRYSLATYLDVMDSIFSHLQEEHPTLYLQLLDFQERHIHKISIKY